MSFNENSETFETPYTYKNHFFLYYVNCLFYRKTPANVSKEYLFQEMRLMNELIIPGIFGYDVQRNLTRLQDIIDDNHLSILNVMNLVRIENFHHAHSMVTRINFTRIAFL